MIELPEYLKKHNTKESFGELSYNNKRKSWTIKAEPMVIEFAKRLFPSSDTRKRGEVSFSNHRRFVAEINWLMMRYPLTIRERDIPKWDISLREAQSAYIDKQSHTSYKRVKPPKFAFNGELNDFQEEGCAFLENNDRALLADDMGLGKTVQALALLSRLCNYPCLIVPPAHLVNNWINEINRFLKDTEHGIRVHHIKGLKPYDLPPADIYVAHYLILRGWKSALPEYKFPIVIFDEIQELRHGGTEKYSVASLLSSNAQRVYGLSGTPIYNNGGEIWQVINILDMHFLGSFDAFTREWCYGYRNNIVIKPEKLGAFLYDEGLMIRRRKEDVLPNLPPKRRIVNIVDSDKDIFSKYIQSMIEKLSQWNNEMSSSERNLFALDIDRSERMATGIAKAPYVSTFVRMLLDSGEKVLLFAHHHIVFDYYKSHLKSEHPVFITGRETTVQKQKAIERFMNGNSNLCCISLRAAAGLNLQRATCVVFGELDWSPAVHSQAEDRAHRIGQTDSLLCYYLVSENGSDPSMQDALGLKVSQFKALMNDPVETFEQSKFATDMAIKHTNMLFDKYILNKED